MVYEMMLIGVYSPLQVSQNSLRQTRPNKVEAARSHTKNEDTPPCKSTKKQMELLPPSKMMEPIPAKTV